MRIQFDLKFRDVVLFQSVHQFLSLTMQGLCLLVVWMICHFETADGRPADLVATMALIAYMFMWLLQITINAVSLVSRRNRNLLTRHTIELKAEEMTADTALIKSQMQWPALEKVVSRPGFLAVYVSSQRAYVIPNRAFSSPAQRAEFLAICRQRRIAPVS